MKATVQEQSTKNKIINSSLIICPVCNKQGFLIQQSLDVVPYFGEVLETFASCKLCGYKTHDILPLENKTYPKLHKINISIRNLNKRVIKGKQCSIKIPEIGLTIEPGSDSEAYISNIEGVLDRIIDSLKSIAVVKHENKKEIKAKIEKIEEAKKGKAKLTLIFEDKKRQSAVIDESKKELR